MTGGRYRDGFNEQGSGKRWYLEEGSESDMRKRCRSSILRSGDPTASDGRGILCLLKLGSE